MKDNMEIPQKIRIELSCDPAVPLPGLYSNHMKTLSEKASTKAKILKQPKCPSKYVWIKM